MKAEHQAVLDEKAAAEQAAKEAAEAKQAKIDAFFKSLEESADLNENL